MNLDVCKMIIVKSSHVTTLTSSDWSAITKITLVNPRILLHY